MVDETLQAAFEIKTACDEISRKLLRWHWEQKPGAHSLDALLKHLAQRQKESPDYYDRMPDLSGKTSWQQLDTTLCMRVLLDPEKDAAKPLDLLGNTPHPSAARRACNAVRTARNEAAHAADRTDGTQAAILFNEAIESLEEGYAGTAFKTSELEQYYRMAEDFLSRCGAKSRWPRPGQRKKSPVPARETGMAQSPAARAAAAEVPAAEMPAAQTAGGVRAGAMAPAAAVAAAKSSAGCTTAAKWPWCWWRRWCWACWSGLSVWACLQNNAGKTKNREDFSGWRSAPGSFYVPGPYNGTRTQKGGRITERIGILPLFGGLALFLFGMDRMSEALQQAAGERLRRALAALTCTPLTGALAGMVVTAVVQSSSATTVMVIGFVSAGLLELPQAVAVIFGANIGTTVTAQLLAFRVEEMLGLVLFGGFFLCAVARTKRGRQMGTAVFSFGLLFAGMEQIQSVVEPLALRPEFEAWMAQVREKPLWGLLLGLAGAVPVLLGDNVGTTITAILAAAGGTRDAKRAAAAHCCFNLSGSLVGLLALPWFVRLVELLPPEGEELEIIARQIANAHTLFNALCTLIWLPLTPLMVRLVTTLVPEKRTE